MWLKMQNYTTDGGTDKNLNEVLLLANVALDEYSETWEVSDKESGATQV